MTDQTTRKARIIVKAILIFALIAFFFPFDAISDCEITLQWPAISPGHAGYRVYGREEGYDYNYEEPWWEGDQTFSQCIIDLLDEDKTYYFVIRVYDEDNYESSDSNEVSFQCDHVINKSEKATGTDKTNPSSPESSRLGQGASTSGGSAGCFISAVLRP